MEIKYHQQGSLQIAYQDEGEGEAIVFLHGLGANSESWDFQAEYFSDHYRVIRPEFRGFGRSSKPHDRNAYSVKIFAEDIVFLLKHLGVARATIIGTSMGGYMAQTIALEYPALVEKLVLCHTACSRRVPEKIMRERLAALEVMDMAAYAKVAIAHAVGPDTEESVKQRIVDMIAANDHTAYLIIFGEGGLDFDLCSRLGELDVPSWVISSELDQVVPFARSQELHERIAGSQFFNIPDTGHLSYLENPVIFNQYLEMILNDPVSDLLSD